MLALGSIPHFHNLPGVAENSLTLKTLQDATVLRNHVISLLEQADVEPDETVRRRQLTFVVVGAGFAGTEMIAELFDLTHSALRYYPRISSDDLRFVVIHSRGRICLNSALTWLIMRCTSCRHVVSSFASTCG